MSLRFVLSGPRVRFMLHALYGNCYSVRRFEARGRQFPADGLEEQLQLIKQIP
jgi:hypothetical protein